MPCGRNTLWPGSGSTSKRLSALHVPEAIASTAKTARIAIERTATTIANRNEIAAPAVFKAMKIAYRTIHQAHVGSSRPKSGPVMPFA